MAMRLRFWLYLGASALSAPALAQQPEEEAGLSEIVVTAQKREERLQDTPLAISAITTATLEARGISDAGALSAIAPNLVVSQTAASATSPAIFIRGIGEAEPLLTIDHPNALYVDGAVVGRSTGAIFDLVDLERVEVLRGPQGTLFGRNTTGGAVNLITKRPSDKFGAELIGGYGRFSLWSARATVDTGSIGGSGFKAKFSYLHRQRNGYIDNVLASKSNDPGAYKVDAFRVALAYDKDGPVRAFYSFDFNKRVGRAIPVQLAAAFDHVTGYLAASPLLGGAPLQIGVPRQNRITLDDDGDQTDKVQGHTLTLEAELGDQMTLRSISSFRRWKNDILGTDLDGNGEFQGFVVSPAILAPPFDFIPLGVEVVSLYEGFNNRRQRQWSQELNLIGKIGDRVEFVLGAFHFEERAREADNATIAIIIPSPVPIDLGPGISVPAFATKIDTLLDYRHKSTSTALFGQATFAVTDRFELTGGMRYTWDRKTLDLISSGSLNQRAKFGQFTWLGTARYEFSDDVSAYARVATGYKAGGFNARTAGNTFDPERVISYEAGLKSELLGRRLRVNLAAFYTKYRDLQVSQFQAGTGGAQTITVNAGKATYKGIELEVAAQPTRSLTLTGNLGYTGRKYNEYLFLDPATDTIINIADQARFGYSAGTTASASVEQRFALGSAARLTLRADYTYRGRLFFHPVDALAPFNTVISDKNMSTIDARATLSGLKLGGSELSLALWGKNLTNNDYLHSGIDFGQLGFAITSHAEPRTWGIEAKVKF
jgi:iron complex outermembrane recepter protein